MDSHWLETLVKKFDKENRISSIVSVETESAVPKGENYGSIVSRASMSVILSSGRKTTRRIIIKEAHKDPKMQEMMKEFNLFKYETMVYKNVLSEMEEIMNEYGDTGDILWPNILGYKPYTSIVFDDLTMKGFKVAERRNCLDLDHGLLVVRGLAKFHALSRILLDRGVVGKGDFDVFWASTDKEATRGLIEGTFRQLSHSMVNYWPSKWKPMGLKIQQQIPVGVNKRKSVFELKEDGFHVINHGDPWTCNMLFKYSPFRNDPISVKFIDFQTCHYNSYIFDLIYFIYTSIVPAVRRKHLNEMLSAYQEALEHYLKFYSYEGKIPSLNDVKAEHQRAQYWSLVCLATIHVITSADTTDAFELDKIIPDNGEERDSINPEVLKSEKLINSIGPDFEIYAENSII